MGPQLCCVAKLYKAATMPLATKFDGTSDKYFLILNDVTQQVEGAGVGNSPSLPSSSLLSGMTVGKPMV